MKTTIRMMALALALALAGCEQDERTAGFAGPLSGDGESCERTADCAAGLVCVEQVCEHDGAPGEPDGLGGADAGAEGDAGAEQDVQGEDGGAGDAGAGDATAEDAGDAAAEDAGEQDAGGMDCAPMVDWVCVHPKGCACLPPGSYKHTEEEAEAVCVGGWGCSGDDMCYCDSDLAWGLTQEEAEEQCVYYVGPDCDAD